MATHVLPESPHDQANLVVMARKTYDKVGFVMTAGTQTAPQKLLS